jgi:hypothetical protein
MLGDNHIFRRAALISRVVINLRFLRDGKEVIRRTRPAAGCCFSDRERSVSVIAASRAAFWQPALLRGGHLRSTYEAPSDDLQIDPKNEMCPPITQEHIS